MKEKSMDYFGELPRYFTNNTSITGYKALYDVMMQSELPQYSIVVAIIDGQKVIFQTSEELNVFSSREVHPLKGTLVFYKEDGSLTLADTVHDYHYSMNTLRFPTREELAQYEKIDTV